MVEPPQLSIERELDGDTARLRVAGELDIATVEELEQEVDELLERPLGRLIIDLAPLTFIDSSALRLFIVLADRASGEEWTLALIRPQGPVMSVFQISGAEDNLPFIDEDTE